MQAPEEESKRGSIKKDESLSGSSISQFHEDGFEVTQIIHEDNTIDEILNATPITRMNS